MPIFDEVTLSLRLEEELENSNEEAANALAYLKHKEGILDKIQELMKKKREVMPTCEQKSVYHLHLVVKRIIYHKHFLQLCRSEMVLVLMLMIEMEV